VADRYRVTDLWLEPGDILIERSNTPQLVGTARLYRGPKNFAIFPDLLIRARLSSLVLPLFVELALQTTTSRSYLTRSARGIAGSMPKINQTTIERLPVPLPPAAEQERIVSEVERRLSAVDETEATIATGLRRAERLRQATLKRAFEGKLVPQDSNDEPASVLLERIREEREADQQRQNGRTRRRAGVDGYAPASSTGDPTEEAALTSARHTPLVQPRLPHL
jgi:type I restriction enzyme S subunit